MTALTEPSATGILDLEPVAGSTPAELDIARIQLPPRLRPAASVSVLDISEGGCRFFDKFGRLIPGARITVRIGAIGPIEATVRWCEDQVVGVEFDNPIYGPVLEHIRRQLGHDT